MDTRFRSGVLAIAAAISVTACARENGTEDRPETVAQAAQDTGGMQGMQGMQGMGGSGMMEQMQAHMRMMDAVGADSMEAMLPMHRQMVANMISQFDREMRQMNMKADPAWQATIDSLRQDNVRMPEMSAGELRTFMPEHRRRLMRLMEMHRSMMGNMRM